MKGVEDLGEVLAEIRVGEGIAAATIARANLRRAHEKIASPEGTAREHGSPKSTEQTRPTERIKPTEQARLTERIKPTVQTRSTERIKPTRLQDRPPDQ
jgi:hypothetical protein